MRRKSLQPRPAITHDEVLVLIGGYTPCSKAYRDAIDRKANIEARLSEQGMALNDFIYDDEWAAAEDRISDLLDQGHLGQFVREEQSAFVKAAISANGGNPL